MPHSRLDEGPTGELIGVPGVYRTVETRVAPTPSTYVVGNLECGRDLPRSLAEFGADFCRAIGLNEPIRVRVGDDLQESGLNGMSAMAVGGGIPSCITVSRHRLAASAVDAVPGYRMTKVAPAAHETLVHELIHVRWPRWQEDTVRRAAQQFWLHHKVPNDRSPWEVAAI